MVSGARPLKAYVWLKPHIQFSFFKLEIKHNMLRIKTISQQPFRTLSLHVPSRESLSLPPYPPSLLSLSLSLSLSVSLSPPYPLPQQL